MEFVDRKYLEDFFAGKTVAIVGSGPGVLGNELGWIDSHDLVIRVNNYKCVDETTGFRCDVHYSFFGGSIKKTAEELKNDGVRLVCCKCPNAQFMKSPWHEEHGKQNGVAFQYIYKMRRDFWFCPTYIPSLEEFKASFDLLHKHIPSTGFSALLLIKSLAPKSIFATGFDLFSSQTHNLNEVWRPGNPNDPIGHVPHLERRWLASHVDSIGMDATLTKIVLGEK